MCRSIAKLEKNYNGFGNHLTCVWHYLSSGIIEAHSPGGRQGGGEQAPLDIGGLGTVLSPHKRRATQQFQEQPGHKLPELMPLNRYHELRPHKPGAATSPGRPDAARTQICWGSQGTA